MKRIIDTSEMLGTVETPEGRCEVCAAAVATFDESAGRMTVELDTFLRPANLLIKERHIRAAWLPKGYTLTESVGREECHQMAREIFQRWVRKVREAAPSLHQA